MKKNFKKIINILVLAGVLSLTGCGQAPDANNEDQGNVQQEAGITPVTEPTTGALKEVVDYASAVTLNMSSETPKVEVTVKSFVDGDTTHFYVPADIVETGVLKARYLAINTPESTGKIEEWGKKASRFTKEQLEKATSIIIESDTAEWNIDSTGDRNLVWVWYKTSDSEEYRNLNIEILQNGLAIANSTANNRYGTFAMAALNQAKEQKLNIFSGQKDPDFFYGEALELTAKELRCNTEIYSGMKVAFSGVVTKNANNSVYVESYDEETGMYYGMAVYYGFNLPGPGLEALTVGNETRIVGTLQFYETGGTWQVAGLSYRQMKPDDPNNVQKLSDGHKPAYVLTEADTFVNKAVEVEIVSAEGEEVIKTFPYAELAMSTSIAMENLKVKEVYTTTNEESSSKGAMTLTCEAEDGTVVTVRTLVLTDENNKMITADAYEGKTIDVRGIVDYFDGEYQIKVFVAEDITIK